MIVKIAQYPDGRRRIIIRKLRNKEPIQVILDSFAADIPAWLADKFNALPDNRAK